MKHSQVLTAGDLASFFSLHVLLLNHLKLCLGKKQEKNKPFFFSQFGKRYEANVILDIQS